MKTKDHNGKASPMRKGGQPQQNRIDKEPRNLSSMNNNNCMTDMEQQESSNKGKGPAGENL